MPASWWAKFKREPPTPTTSTPYSHLMWRRMEHEIDQYGAYDYELWGMGGPDEY